MVDTKIQDFPPGDELRNRLAQLVFTQNNVTYNGSARPNPPQQVNILNQDQLESELNSNLEIPDNTAIDVIMDGAMTLDKQIKPGLSSTIHFKGSTSDNILNYTGPGNLIQNKNPVDTISEVLLENLHIIGDTTNSVFDIIGNAQSSVICRDVVFQDLNDIGVIDTGAFDFSSCSMRNINVGLIFKKQQMGRMNRFSFSQPNPTGITAFSFIAGVNPMDITIDTARVVATDINNSLFSIDPNLPDGSVISITDSDSGDGNFYQPGTEITAASAQDNGSGGTEFVTSGVHNLIVGQSVVLYDFTGIPAYNGTFIVTAMDSTISFEVTVPFDGADTGFVNATSLTSTDIRVLSEKNKGSPDSMFIAETGLDIFGSEITIASVAQDGFSIITDVNWVSLNLERFIEGVINTGQLVCIDPGIKKYNISYSATIEKSGGGGTDIGIIILKNGLNVAFNPPHTSNTGKIQISGTDIIELTDTDTLDIAVINYDATSADIIISQASLVVSRA